MSHGIDEAWDIEDLPLDWCVAPQENGVRICTNETAVIDAIGLPWCEECSFRGKFLDWGLSHGWPELEMEPFKVAQGMFHWVIAAILGKDDMIWLLLGAIEMLEEQTA